MNCGIYAVLCAFRDLGKVISVAEHENDSRNGTVPFWLQQNIFPPGFLLSAPYPPSAEMLKERMKQGHKAIGRIPGRAKEAHMVYIKEVSECGDILTIEDNNHSSDYQMRLSELGSIYFIVRVE